jgi:hypothetical protein
MLLSSLHKRQVLVLYCIIFYVLMIWKWWHGLFLYEVQPFLFNNRFDFTTWSLMQTGIHQWLLNNKNGWILFDAVFYSMPLLLFLANRLNRNATVIVAFLLLLVNWVYLQCYTLYPTNSIESYTAWLLFPILFCMGSTQGFYFVLHALRYFFLFFFASAGVWKLTSLSVANAEQMSAVLLYQHADYMATSPGAWYTSFTYWLVQHPVVSQSMYVAGTLLELAFIIGFFTRKYDRLLLLAFILFLLADILLMRIHYWEISAFMITLLYSRLEVKTKATNYLKG